MDRQMNGCLYLIAEMDDEQCLSKLLQRAAQCSVVSSKSRFGYFDTEHILVTVSFVQKRPEELSVDLDQIRDFFHRIKTQICIRVVPNTDFCSWGRISGYPASQISGK